MSDGYDLVSVGGGLAGLTAAARAAELGARVAVLEKGEAPDYLCNSRISGGVFHIAYQDVKLPGPELKSHAVAAAGDVADPDLLDVMVSDARRAVDWFRLHGGQFVRGPQQAWVMAPPRARVNALDWKGRGPDMLLRHLTDVVRRSGGEIMLAATARSLMMEDGRCVGVRVSVGGQELALRASAVVIADGGYQCDPELFRTHIGPSPERVFQRNARTSDGAGLKMAVAAGAATTGLGRFYGHLLSADAFSNDDVWPFPQVDLVGAAGIIVDRRGRRILDEGLGGIYATNQIASLKDPASATVICDQAIWETAGREALVPPNPGLEQGGGTIYRADRIEALAELAGVDPDGLAATLAEYNASIQAERGGELDPPRTGTKRAPQPITDAPFIAIPVCAGLTNTMGGLKIDRDARVIGIDGRPIEGLYAAGAASGGLEGGPKVSYFGGLSRAGVFGLRAAEHALSAGGAAREPAPSSPAGARSPMDAYPMLRVLRRHGKGAAFGLSALAALGVAALAWPLVGAAAVLPAVAVGCLIFFLVRVLAELVSMIVDVLLPQ